MRHFTKSNKGEAHPDVIFMSRCTGCLETSRKTKVGGQSRCFISITTGIYVKIKLGTPYERKSLNIPARQMFIRETSLSLKRRIMAKLESQPVQNLSFYVPNLPQIDLITNITNHESLTIIKENLKDFPILSFHTDGSLSGMNTPDVCMGIGWIQHEPNTFQCEYSAQVKNWPSSTRAEAWAILSAIYVCPQNCQVKIFTDSQACIDRYLSCINPLLTNRKSLKIPNGNIWSCIMDLIQTYNISLHFTKVKGHSTDDLNNKADLLAKRGRTLTPVLDIHPNVNSRKNMTMKWNHHVMEGAIRQQITYLNRLYYDEVWHTSYAGKSLDEINNLCDWPMTWKNIRHVESALPASDKQTSAVTFKLKNLNMTLPTLEFLKLTQPHIYDDSWLCPKCGTAKETWRHVYLCPQQRRFLELCIEMVIEKLVDTCGDYTIDTNDIFKDKLSKLNIWQIPAELNPRTNQRSCNVLDLIRGVVPYQLPRFLKSYMFADTKVSVINNISISCLSYFISLINKEIWIERCDTLKEIQQERGFDQRKLRVKYTQRNRQSTTPITSSNTQTTAAATNVLHKYLDTFEDYIKFGLRD